MRFGTTALVIALALGFLLAGCSESRADRREERRDDRHDRRVEAMTDWEKLGERMVNYRAGGDRDTVMVTATEGRFTKMMIKVEHSSLEMYDIEVTFGDGQRWSPNTRLHFGEDTRSRIIDLPGGGRFIRKVEFHYRNLPRGGRAQVELWGKK